jgi:LysR family glycine cleavage system transcriptional activator
MVDLLTEDFDFAIRYDQLSPEIYDEEQLFGDFVLPVCTPEFAKHYHLSHKQKSLEGVPLIHLDERTPDPQWADWIKWGGAFGFQQDTLQTGIRLTEFNSGIQTAIRGQGLVLCGITEAYNAIKEDILVAPFGPKLNCPTSYQYRLVSIHGRELSKLQGQFQDWVVKIAREFRSEVNEFISTV